MEIYSDITGARQSGLTFDRFPDALRGLLVTEITSLGAELLAMVEGRTPERTGALRAAERLRVFSDKPGRIAARVDIAAAKGSQGFAKAAALEYGAHRPGPVKAHKMRLDHVWENALAAPIDVLVAAHSRTPNIAEHAFERGALAEMQPQVLGRLNAVVAKAVAEANAG